MEAILSIAVGLGLAAACGFRVFVPLLLVAVANRTGHLELAGGFDWMSSNPALWAFGTATVLEIVAYWVPFVDNLLDTLAAPSAVVAGTLVTASQIGDMDPWLTWSVSAIGGGGISGVVQGLTTVTRQISSLATAGFGNPLVSTLEAGASVLMVVLAIFVPFIALGLLLMLLLYGGKKLLMRQRGPEEFAA